MLNNGGLNSACDCQADVPCARDMCSRVLQGQRCDKDRNGRVRLMSISAPYGSPYDIRLPLEFHGMYSDVGDPRGRWKLCTCIEPCAQTFTNSKPPGDQSP